VGVHRPGVEIDAAVVWMRGAVVVHRMAPGRRAGLIPLRGRTGFGLG